jgi:hypothetical protein
MVVVVALVDSVLSTAELRADFTETKPVHGSKNIIAACTGVLRN